ncbi:MAG TPA: CoA pyrophosphatase [Thermoflexales bacterium]|jgi:8-oxo-dGTP pyrophosphatase MutT (NUDIX family)|nr:CoA pyrophosphatase [Anaerolineae bacterium]HQV29137.1 CoA pyrophosphatase [Thermoflexales bacterium]HQX11714.1 CoA pyrophosphatase [Thermoflexales bacterium]HQY25315.1 CoA pyrophosphatase [Thermoflexales bacterium]HQZ54947.1 CoA pyrophosphatase [Thermoflexales bacterium]
MLVIDLAREALRRPLPGFAGQSRMMPPGRFVPPDISAAHLGGVLVLLYPVDGVAHVVLTRRTETLGKHRGQISFPGGRMDAGDHDLIATALRETREELGIEVSEANVLGTLTPLYIPPSNYLIHPAVAALPGRPRFAPNPAEVAEVIEVALETLATPEARSVGPMPVVRNGTTFVVDMPHFVVGGHRVWGATAMVLAELLEALGDTP